MSGIRETSHDGRGGRCLRRRDPRDRGAACRSTTSCRSSSTRSGRSSAPSTRRSASSTPTACMERFITSGHGRREHARRHRPLASRPRPAGPHRPREPLVPDPGHRRRPATLRVPAAPPADAQLPRRAGHGARVARSATSTSPNKAGADEFTEDDQALVETFAVHAGDRDRERPAPRAGPAARDRRRARAHQPGPARRDHPEHLRASGSRSRTCPSSCATIRTRSSGGSSARSTACT